MNGAVERAMHRSSKDFIEVVWPSLGPVLGGGNLIPVETVTANDFTATLDRTAGIDAWIVQAERLPESARVQRRRLA